METRKGAYLTLADGKPIRFDDSISSQVLGTGMGGVLTAETDVASAGIAQSFKIGALGNMSSGRAVVELGSYGAPKKLAVYDDLADVTGDGVVTATAVTKKIWTGSAMQVSFNTSVLSKYKALQFERSTVILATIPTNIISAWTSGGSYANAGISYNASKAGNGTASFYLSGMCATWSVSGSTMTISLQPSCGISVTQNSSGVVTIGSSAADPLPITITGVSGIV